MARYENYPLMEATENGLSVRRDQEGRFSVHMADGTRLFEDRDIERVRAYLYGYMDAIKMASCR